MALVKCKECGKEISSQARKCPHCGKSDRVDKVKIKSKKIFKLIMLSISIIVSFIILCIGMFLLINQLIDIPKLNYPLTSIIPLLVICLVIGLTIIFEMGMFKWKKRNVLKKIF